MQCWEGNKSHHVGSIDLNFIKEVQKRAEKYCYRHAVFTSFNKVVLPIKNQQNLELTMEIEKV